MLNNFYSTPFFLFKINCSNNKKNFKNGSINSLGKRSNKRVVEPDNLTPGIIEKFSSLLNNTISFGFTKLSTSFLRKLYDFIPKSIKKSNSNSYVLYT